MKLFISYGHDLHRDFMRRLKGDLERVGHPAGLIASRSTTRLFRGKVLDA